MNNPEVQKFYNRALHWFELGDKTFDISNVLFHQYDFKISNDRYFSLGGWHSEGDLTNFSRIHLLYVPTLWEAARIGGINLAHNVSIGISENETGNLDGSVYLKRSFIPRQTFLELTSDKAIDVIRKMNQILPDKPLAAFSLLDTSNPDGTGFGFPVERAIV